MKDYFDNYNIWFFHVKESNMYANYIFMLISLFLHVKHLISKSLMIWPYCFYMYIFIPTIYLYKSVVMSLTLFLVIHTCFFPYTCTSGKSNIFFINQVYIYEYCKTTFMTDYSTFIEMIGHLTCYSSNDLIMFWQLWIYLVYKWQTYLTRNNYKNNIVLNGYCVIYSVF